MGDKEKRSLAVALRYQQGMDAAPRIVATGKGLVAERIVKVAKESKIPIQERPELADTLANLEVGQFIPTALYSVVAEVLAYVYYLDKQLGKK